MQKIKTLQDLILLSEDTNLYDNKTTLILENAQSMVKNDSNIDHLLRFLKINKKSFMDICNKYQGNIYIDDGSIFIEFNKHIFNNYRDMIKNQYQIYL